MKTKLQTALAAIAPSISIVTIWEHGYDADREWRELSAGDNCFAGEDPDDWECWQSEVRATAIVSGEEITGNDYLGGTWEKAGDHPAQSNPEISGYENQMTRDALEELASQIHPGNPIQSEIAAAMDYCKAEARRAHEAQRAEIEAARVVATV